MEVQSLGDASVKIQDLEDARRELIALSGIPSPLKNRDLKLNSLELSQK